MEINQLCAGIRNLSGGSLVKLGNAFRNHAEAGTVRRLAPDLGTYVLICALFILSLKHGNVELKISLV